MPARPETRRDSSTPRHTRRRYHFSSAGVSYICVTLLVALGAFNSQNNLLFFAFGFALALLLVSGIISGAMLMSVSVQREPVADTEAGRPLLVRYRVRNHSRFVPLFALSIGEEGMDAATPPPPRHAAHRALSRLMRAKPAPAPGPERIGRPAAFLVHLAPGGAAVVDASTTAHRRGPVVLTAVRVETSFPFGLIRKSLLFPQAARAVITPAVASALPAELASASSRGFGGSVTRRSGQGDDFFSLREYIQGDSPRDIAWRASARRGALLVRQTSAPAPQRLWIVPHLRLRPGSDHDDERAISLAAGIARWADARGIEFGLAAPITRAMMVPRRGGPHMRRMLEMLGMLDLGPDDGRGRRTAFPPQAAMRGAECVVVHAGPIDPAFHGASDRILHVSSDTLPDLPHVRASKHAPAKAIPA